MLTELCCYDLQIVPPNQAITMFEALKKKGVKCAYVNFPGKR